MKRGFDSLAAHLVRRLTFEPVTGDERPRVGRPDRSNDSGPEPYRRRRLFFASRLVLALVLLVGQAGSQLHAYVHAVSDSRSTDPAGLRIQPCNQCLSFAPLHFAVPASCAMPPVDADAATPVPSQAAGPLSAQVRFHGFQSRAPPAHL